MSMGPCRPQALMARILRVKSFLHYIGIALRPMAMNAGTACCQLSACVSCVGYQEETATLLTDTVATKWATLAMWMFLPLRCSLAWASTRNLALTACAGHSSKAHFLAALRAFSQTPKPQMEDTRWTKLHVSAIAATIHKSPALGQGRLLQNSHKSSGRDSTQ